MMKFIKRPKALAAVATLLLMLIAVPVVYGGIQWSGFDPQVQINRTQYNVTVLAPDKAWCDVDGDIEVVFHVEAGAETKLDFESTGGSSACTVSTSTTFDADDGNSGVGVSILVNSSGNGRFPVVVEVASDGEEAVCRGVSGKSVSCSLDN